MQNAHPFFYDENGRLRSGWRAAAFLFVFTLSVLLCVSAGVMAISALGINVEPETNLFLAINSAISLALAIFFGWLFGRSLEGLPFRALGAAFTSGWFRNLVGGLAAGALTLTFAVLPAVAGGGLAFQYNPSGEDAIARSLAFSFVVFALAAAFEEALFRGYILQTFARSGLAWLAIVLTSVFFGAVHLGNPNINVIAAINTVLAGVWFSVAYLKTRDLWFVWGMHLMWNWVQGSIFGIEVSGLTSITTTPLLVEVDTGPSWLTGETYGIEGGILCTVALVVSTAVIYFIPWLKPDAEMLALTSKPEPLA